MTSPSSPIFLGSEITQPDPADAAYHIIPVPYEKTVSYGAGTSRGPSVIIDASHQLETWDGKSNPSISGIYTHAPLTCSDTAENVLNELATLTKGIRETGAIPICLGGEHTITYGAVKGINQSVDAPFGVIQIDAHADLRDTYEGSPLNHACVMKRIHDMKIPILQLGVRALCEEECAVRSDDSIYYHDAAELVAQNITDITLPEEFPNQVYITVDIDGFDPSVFPSTGTPVPGGLNWYQGLSLLESVIRNRKILGCDVVEFSPISNHHAYDFSAASLVYQLIGLIDRESRFD